MTVIITMCIYNCKRLLLLISKKSVHIKRIVRNIVFINEPKCTIFQVVGCCHEAVNIPLWAIIADPKVGLFINRAGYARASPALIGQVETHAECGVQRLAAVLPCGGWPVNTKRGLDLLDVLKQDVLDG